MANEFRSYNTSANFYILAMNTIGWGMMGTKDHITRDESVLNL